MNRIFEAINNCIKPHPFTVYCLPFTPKGMAFLVERLIFIFLFVFSFWGCQCAYGTSVPIQSIQQAPQQTAQSSPIQPQPVDFSNCSKSFKFNSQKLFYLTVAGVNANRFKIDEIQSKSGYVLFSVAQKQFLGKVISIDAQTSMLKITPCNNVYYFPVGIVQNMFKYIELNTNTPIEKLNVL